MSASPTQNTNARRVSIRPIRPMSPISPISPLSALFAIILLVVTGSSAMAQSAKPPTHLRVEYLDKPMGLDVEKPRFSWYVNDTRRGAKQTAYRILVASSLDGLKSPKPDIWDSGTIATD